MNYDEKLLSISINQLKLNEDKTIDKTKILTGKLTWLPWVGSEYEKTEKKLLVVGESHYYNPDEINSFEKHTNINFTRISIEELGVKQLYKNDKNYNVKITENFHKALVRTDSFDSSKFWERVAYVNLLQFPMKTNAGRPSDKQFKESWPSLFELIKMISPDQVLFIGNSSANLFNTSAKSMKIKHDKMIYNGEKIGGAFPKRSAIYLNDKKIQFDFIRHTSKHFSWDQWNKYLLSENIIQPFIQGL